jgi:hypothetical protein
VQLKHGFHQPPYAPKRIHSVLLYNRHGCYTSELYRLALEWAPLLEILYNYTLQVCTTRVDTDRSFSRGRPTKYGADGA